MNAPPPLDDLHHTSCTCHILVGPCPSTLSCIIVYNLETYDFLLFKYCLHSLMLRPQSQGGKGIWWIWTQSLGQGKEFDCSNLAQSYYDSPAMGMWSTIACFINLNRQPAPLQHYHVAHQSLTDDAQRNYTRYMRYIRPSWVLLSKLMPSNMS